MTHTTRMMSSDSGSGQISWEIRDIIPIACTGTTGKGWGEGGGGTCVPTPSAPYPTATTLMVPAHLFLVDYSLTI